MDWKTKVSTSRTLSEAELEMVVEKNRVTAEQILPLVKMAMNSSASLAPSSPPDLPLMSDEGDSVETDPGKEPTTRKRRKFLQRDGG